MLVPDSASKAPPGTVEMIATPGAATATSGPKHEKVGENMPSGAITTPAAEALSHVRSGYSPDLPTAATASGWGEGAGFCSGPAELPAATTQATPLSVASSIFCSTAAE